MSVAAARIINRNCSEILATGIKNVIRPKNDEAGYRGKIIVNAQVNTIFLSLAVAEYFDELAMLYWPHAHRDIQSNSIVLLKKQSLHDFAAVIVEGETVRGFPAKGYRKCIQAK